MGLFEWDPNEKPKPPPIPEGHIQVNPDTFPDQTRPATEVARWCNEAGMRIRDKHLKPFIFNVRRMEFLNSKFVNDGNDPTEDELNAMHRRDDYWHEARKLAYLIIEDEWVGSRAWEILTPDMRTTLHCSAVWETEPDAVEVLGATWQMEEAKRLPEGFSIMELMGYMWQPWSESNRLNGIEEYTKRGWLRGATDIRQAQRTADRKSAIVSAAKEKKRGR